MANQFYTNHKELSQDQKQQIVDYLLAGRLSNSDTTGKSSEDCLHNEAASGQSCVWQTLTS